ncbi:acyl-CoA dehydrogenase family protein [Microbaculum marinum]|uniref:Acyl-CoA dehydrogenase family protein n=1 Tax=Microbaculum marinum TaxID=1764581 RepID=A0AAW9S0J7_9HYPH
MQDPGATHEVFNQVPPLEGFNAFLGDPALKEAVDREGGGWGRERLSALGEWVASSRTQELARLANTWLPVLKTFDRYGNRIDEVEFHPAYHELLGKAIAEEIHALPFADPRSGVYVVRAGLHFLYNFAEIGVLCPVTMTFAAVPTLRQQPEIAAEWEPRIVSDHYDPRFMPAPGKTGAQIGMAMTEKQGGSDVRANTTRAVPLNGGGPGGEYLLTGHKWFCSAPMCDGFLTLANTDAGLTCFFVPRWTPDGERNVFLIQRLKDKLGNKSNASSEIEYRDTWARMVGEEGRGVRTIIEMVHHTRLDTGISAAGIMRNAVARAIHHASHRSAFQKKLVDQPAMRRVLADVALESEASTALAMRVARAFDQGGKNEAEQAFARISVAVAKFWHCKRCPALVAEALELHGGNGYVETGEMARLYREAPLNGIWEGSGNVMALDVLRAIARDPTALTAVMDEMELAAGADRRFDRHLEKLKQRIVDKRFSESHARQIAMELALGLQASLLVRFAPGYVADGFCATRLEDGIGLAFGLLPDGLDEAAIVERARPMPD